MRAWLRKAAERETKERSVGSALVRLESAGPARVEEAVGIAWWVGAFLAAQLSAESAPLDVAEGFGVDTVQFPSVVWPTSWRSRLPAQRG